MHVCTHHTLVHFLGLVLIFNCIRYTIGNKLLPVCHTDFHTFVKMHSNYHEIWWDVKTQTHVDASCFPVTSWFFERRNHVITSLQIWRVREELLFAHTIQKINALSFCSDKPNSILIVLTFVRVEQKPAGKDTTISLV